MARQNADKKKAFEEEQRKKKILLEKRMEADGGRYAKKIQANQKATVKVNNSFKQYHTVYHYYIYKRIIRSNHNTCSCGI